MSQQPPAPQKRDVGASSGKHPERLPEFRTASGMQVPSLSLPKIVDNQYRENLGFPGEHPFTRGIYPSMYRGRLWTFRQYSGLSR